MTAVKSSAYLFRGMDSRCIRVFFSLIADQIWCMSTRVIRAQNTVHTMEMATNSGMNRSGEGGVAPTEMPKTSFQFAFRIPLCILL